VIVVQFLERRVLSFNTKGFVLEVFVEESLANEFPNQKTCKLISTNQWQYSIYKVTYVFGEWDESKSREDLLKLSRRKLEYYVLATDSHIEGDADRFSPDCDWFFYDKVEEVGTLSRTRTHLGYGKYKTIESLKMAYCIRSSKVLK